MGERERLTRKEDQADGARDTCAGGDCGCGPIVRREFIRLAGAGAASLASIGGLGATAGPFEAKDVADHFVPADKKLSPAWVKNLFARGERTFYSGNDLATIGMPVGGICAGQVYLTGDGRLTHWDVFNKTTNTGPGRVAYNLDRRPQSPLKQGFAVEVRAGGKTLRRTLDAQGFPGVRFCGEYPIGTVEYRDQDLPVEITLEAFSPFIPLNEEDSALPATLLGFTLKNASSETAEVTLAGWLENAVALHSADQGSGKRHSEVRREKDFTMILGSAIATERVKRAREPIVLADFEGKDYGDWKVEGQAFGQGPARGTLGHQQTVSGFQGKGLVNSYTGRDKSHGRLISPDFKIERPFISFLVGGGKYAAKTCINLLVDEKVVRTATGQNNERLDWHFWNVRDLEGKQARIEIVDQESVGWGHINVDQIEMADEPKTASLGPLEKQPDFGTMGLVLLGPGEALGTASLAAGEPADALFDGLRAGVASAEKPFGESLVGGLGKKLTIGPGTSAQITFAVVWHFPNRPESGHYYATRFRDAAAVAEHLATNLDRVTGQTRLWHRTWYNSSLPHWLLDRLFSTTSTLATATCQWWANGRFWAWEGVGCCRGTCSHVWNYEHAMARLFPRLERSVREMQDFNPQAGFVEETGMVRFRGEDWKMWAGDGQAGTVLKAYREHQVSSDAQFLRRNWPRIRKAMEFLIHEDGNADGLLEGSQHNTYDINFEGPNTMVGSLYLAALRAAEEMAREVGDMPFAETCRTIFESGKRLSAEKLFNGEYFVQIVDLDKFPKFQYADGCLADQLFGQGWAHQAALGYVYPKETVAAALGSIWKYNWAPDVGPQNEKHPPERWFARPGEAGLFTCTWPKSKHLDQGVRYKDEIWTGIEYQVAGNLVWDGLVTEALAICRGVHERYHPAKHNPWNEVECGDHYARGMASYGVFLALSGFEYHGPKKHLGFAPRITPDDFRAAFTTAEGWGTLSQSRGRLNQADRIDVKWGKVELKTLALEVPEGMMPVKAEVTVAGKAVEATMSPTGKRVLLTFAEPVSVKEGESLEAGILFQFEVPTEVPKPGKWQGQGTGPYRVTPEKKPK